MGIDPAVIAERGYRTCDGISELKSLRIDVLRSTDTHGLLLPLHSTEGKPAQFYHPQEERLAPYVVYRPDIPEIGRNGKPRKYIVPSKTGIRLDCHPRCQPALGNPDIPKWITEGQKKADSLVTKGACAIGLLGVDSWRGKNDGRCFTCVGPSQMARPNSYRLMNSPITRSCMRSVLEKHSVRRTNRLIRVRRLMCLLSIFCVFSLPT